MKKGRCQDPPSQLNRKDTRHNTWVINGALHIPPHCNSKQYDFPILFCLHLNDFRVFSQPVFIQPILQLGSHTPRHFSSLWAASLCMSKSFSQSILIHSPSSHTFLTFCVVADHEHTHTRAHASPAFKTPWQFTCALTHRPRTEH